MIDPAAPISPEITEDSPEIDKDELANLVREKFEEARDFRRTLDNERWLPGDDAYNGI